MAKRIAKKNYIKFLGTAGARFVMIRQTRHSGGLWVSCEGTNILIDPGPGSLVRCLSSRPKMDPSVLDGIILTHRHIDHCNDVNVMIEAMTEGGFKKRGVVFCPPDALEGDPVVFKYVRSYLRQIQPIEAEQKYKIGNFMFKTSMRHMHPSITYGLKFSIADTKFGLITDTRYFDNIVDCYAKLDVLIISVVLSEPKPEIFHLSVPEVKTLIEKTNPGKVILTHFGRRLLSLKPHLAARQLSKETGIEVIAATDGMVVQV
jgi:ribonuclease BN (tRNA processing enzyme)